MAIQSSFKNMVLCLSVICIVCSTLLAVVYAVTAAPIQAAAEAKTNAAIAQVVPPFEGSPEEGAVSVDGTEYPYYTVSGASGVAGYAIISSGSGFSGAVQVMVGFYPDGKIYNTAVLSQAETPGLGADIVSPEKFRNQFHGKHIMNNGEFVSLLVVKPGAKADGVETVDGISGGTITSKGVETMLRNCLGNYAAFFKQAGQANAPVADAAPAAEVVEPQTEGGN